MTIGFVGLGLMGAGFTKRLLASGHRVVGYDSDQSKVAEAAGWQVEPATSLTELARAAQTIFICVTTSQAVREVALALAGSGEISGRTVIDVSTTDMGITTEIAAACAAAGARFVDAPVSGGPPAAEAGTLAIMVGGDEAAFAAAKPVLERLGLATHMGGTGAGQATKLVNQALCLTNYVVVAEGLRLAQAYGVDAARIPAALGPGLGNSAVLQAVFPRMLAQDYAPRGYARQVLKDLELVHEATRAQHLSMPMLSQALTLFRLLISQGKSELDGAAIVTLWPEPDAH
ncbi:NAD(P)-dependent oxidoreductase [Enterovirga sp.]|jgi:3-hydroxyisobutyrate dehydrogenase|uniref:NAD(P)-dependent oxidoreductase n=1 Tax=Enterovirga sp. TaxID=2026350 RepID=UPI00263389F8|nr:NAD(P)-dependent oxidoreductase [Enterovirga sp.]MDB5592971.1 putative 2-hydroxy-3-oxopropionate reductase [Enterovirga sp.]